MNFSLERNMTCKTFCIQLDGIGKKIACVRNIYVFLYLDIKKNILIQTYFHRLYVNVFAEIVYSTHKKKHSYNECETENGKENELVGEKKSAKHSKLKIMKGYESAQ